MRQLPGLTANISSLSDEIEKIKDIKKWGPEALPSIVSTHFCS